MLKSLWRRFSPSDLDAAEDRTLARYFLDEGLHADLERLRAQSAPAADLERTLYAAQSYFGA